MSSRTQQPCRQLNNQAIRGAALCYVSPIVVGRCSVVSAKCIVNVKGKSLQKAWRNITRKRDDCDEAVKGIRNVAFFFSAISTSERNEIPTNEDEIEEESDSKNEIPCTAVSQEEIGSSMVKKYFPAISYWIALTTPNGAPANPITVHRALLSNGLKVVANQVGIHDVHAFVLSYDVAVSLLASLITVHLLKVSCRAHKESGAMKELYKVLKDHKNSFIKNLVDASYKQSYVDEARELLEPDASSSDIDVGGSENVVKVCRLVDGSFRSCLAKAVSKLLEAKLQVDSVGFGPPSTQLENAGDLEEQKIHPNRMISDKLSKHAWACFSSFGIVWNLDRHVQHCLNMPGLLSTRLTCLILSTQKYVYCYVQKGPIIWHNTEQSVPLSKKEHSSKGTVVLFVYEKERSVNKANKNKVFVPFIH